MENKNLTMPDHSDRDWSEDFQHENGNYTNKCMECSLYFYGHKRRVICKKCFTPNWHELVKKKRPEDTKDNKAWAGAWLEGEMVGYAKCMVDKVLPKKEDCDCPHPCADYPDCNISLNPKKEDETTSDKWKLSAMLKQDDGVVFNNGECKNGCNCVEVHQFHHGEESLKRGYQCLKKENTNALKKISPPLSVAEPVQPTPSEKEELRKKFDSFCLRADAHPSTIFDFFYSEIEKRDKELNSSKLSVEYKQSILNLLTTDYDKLREEISTLKNQLKLADDVINCVCPRWQMLEVPEVSIRTKSALEKYQQFKK